MPHKASKAFCWSISNKKGKGICLQRGVSCEHDTSLFFELNIFFLIIIAPNESIFNRFPLSFAGNENVMYWKLKHTECTRSLACAISLRCDRHFLDESDPKSAPSQSFSVNNQLLCANIDEASMAYVLGEKSSSNRRKRWIDFGFADVLCCALSLLCWILIIQYCLQVLKCKFRFIWIHFKLLNI